MLLKKLDKSQSQALRIWTGAVRTTPVCAFQVVAGEMPLSLRRKHLLAKDTELTIQLNLH